MKIDIMTLFPQVVNNFLNESIIGRAIKKGTVDVKAINIRDFAFDKHRKCDDEPYSETNGMLMLCEPIYQCHKHLSNDKKVHTIMMSPIGKPFDQAKAKELLGYEHIILVCGHYEGIDQRFIDLCVDEEISLGDFVLTGGEIPAMAVADAVCRLVPDVLSDPSCFEDESHYNGLLEHPHYTRPRVWNGLEVPEILLSGHHAKILEWREKQSLLRTKKHRPDMLKKLKLTKKQIEILNKGE